MLNDKIKVLRKKRGISQEELALQIHVVRQTISKWENGLSVPDADQLIALANVLQVSVNELLGQESRDSIANEEIANELASLNRELAERREKERLISQTNKVRGNILVLTFMGIILLDIIENQIMAVGCGLIAFLMALFILYRNLGLLTVITTTDLRIKSLRITTIFNIILITVCGIGAILIKSNVIQLGEKEEEYLAAFIVSAIILFSGYISPRLPFTKHTGLRLPWTAADEDTWNVAHQVLGVIAIPIGLIYIGCIPLISDFEILTTVIAALWIGIPAGISGIFYYRKFHN